MQGKEWRKKNFELRRNRGSKNPDDMIEPNHGRFSPVQEQKAGKVPVKKNNSQDWQEVG
jgi:hypothetical protein